MKRISFSNPSDPRARGSEVSTPKAVLIWAAVALALAVPLGAAAFSPFLAFRSPIYIAASFAGIAALGLMLFQPLLAAGVLPGLRAYRGRRWHRWVGLALVAAVVCHVGALWITSPPDVLDALFLRSPTPFSLWGVIAMWAIFAAGFLAVLRRRWRLRPWRIAHTSLVTLAVGGTVAHALLIEGAMETMTKLGLCGLALLATVWVVIRVSPWSRGGSRAKDARG